MQVGGSRDGNSAADVDFIRCSGFGPRSFVVGGRPGFLQDAEHDVQCKPARLQEAHLSRPLLLVCRHLAEALPPERLRSRVVVLLERLNGSARRIACDALLLQALDDVALAEAALFVTRAAAREALV